MLILEAEVPFHGLLSGVIRRLSLFLLKQEQVSTHPTVKETRL